MLTAATLVHLTKGFITRSARFALFSRAVSLSAQSSAVQKSQQDIGSTVYQRGIRNLSKTIRQNPQERGFCLVGWLEQYEQLLPNGLPTKVDLRVRQITFRMK